jgi:hypothetical protein
MRIHNSETGKRTSVEHVFGFVALDLGAVKATAVSDSVDCSNTISTVAVNLFAKGLLRR